MADSLNGEFIEDASESDNESFDESEGELLLRSVFESCDVNSNGNVKVSALVDHLLKEAAADENPKILGYLDELAIILDPSGNDIAIDKEMYNQGVRKWIQNVQARSSFHDFDDEEEGRFKGNDDEPRSPGIVYKGRGEGDQNLNTIVNGYSERSLENRSFYSSESSNEWEKSQSEILGRIHELQITNKKLLEEKTKLRSQVDNTEEMNSTLLQEMKEMRNKLSRYDQLLDKNKSLEKDYEALKNTMSEYQTTRDELVSRTSQLEKENSVLQGTLEDYQKADMAKNATLETIQEEKRELLEKLNEQKQLYSDLEVLQDLKQKMMDESSSKSEYMSSFIAELSMANEALKAEKNRLEVDLLESKHEISKLTAMRTPAGVSTREPIFASTPFQREAPMSLQQEIGAEISGNLSISSRERSGHLSFPDSNGSRNVTHESSQSDISVSTAASSDKYSSVAQQIAQNFKKKKDLALKQIAELATFDTNSETEANSKVLMKKWEEGFDSFTTEVEGLAAAKHQADRRAAKLLETLETAKAENQKLAESRERALQKIGDIAMESGEMERRVSELLDEIAREREKVKELQAENDKMTVELNEEKAKNYTLQEEVKNLKRNHSASFEKSTDLDANDESHQQIKELTELVKDLEERIHEYTRKLFDQEEIIENKDSIISQNHKEILRLESSYAETVTKHEKNLREILEMFSVPGDLLPDAEVSNPPSLKQLKEKFERYISSIKLKLQNMSVRDGPIGSEGNDAPSSFYNETASSTNFPDRHYELGSKISRELNAQTAAKTYASVYCQTDLNMHEIEEAIHAYTMLKALRDGDESSLAFADFETRSLTEGRDYENVAPKEEEIVTDFKRKTEHRMELNESPREMHHIENKDNEISANEKDLEGKQSLQSDSPERIPGSSITYIKEDKHYENSDLLEQLILGKTEEPIDLKLASGFTTDSKEKHVKVPDSDSAVDVSDHQRPTERKSPRRLLQRSESVSTDESNTSDEMIVDNLISDRKVSTKSENSVATSEISTVSTASKRARRIGVSAEPVRLPTWTELRESIKLNQQIFLEEEMNLKTSGDEFIRTPKNSIESSHSNKGIDNRIGEFLTHNEILSKSAELENSDAANTSMEWWYEVPSDQQNQGINSVTVQQKRDAVSFSAPQSKISTSSSVNSVPESYQTLKSNESGVGDGKAATKEHSKSSASVEEEKGSETSSERKDVLSPLKSTPLLASEEQHPHMAQLEKELEKRYNAIVLSFKTDQYTLQRRLENQERARDVAESGMEREIRKLAENLQSAGKFAVTLEMREIMENLQSHTDVLRKAGMKVSAQAEQHGCFQQESKAAPIMDCVINYAEHLRLSLERSKEAEEIRNKDIITDSQNSLRMDENDAGKKYGYCEKCRGTLTFEDQNSVKENFFSEEKKSKRSGSRTFFGLASSILRERKNVQSKEESNEITEGFLEDRQDFSSTKSRTNYASNEDTSETESVVRPERPSKSYCECFGTVIRFFLSVAIMSAMLLVFAKYVEVDLTLLNKNWNDKLVMYGKKFFSGGKKSAV